MFHRLDREIALVQVKDMFMLTDITDMEKTRNLRKTTRRTFGSLDTRAFWLGSSEACPQTTTVQGEADSNRHYYL